MARIEIRVTDEEKEQATLQASKLGLSITDYIKLIIKLDSATSLIKVLKDGIKKD